MTQPKSKTNMDDELELPIFEELDRFQIPVADTTQLRTKAIDSVCVMGAIVYVGFWFQFTRRDRILWNHMLLHNELPDPSMGLGALHARHVNELSSICFQQPKRPKDE